MAQKAFIWLQDPPSLNGSDIQFTAQVTYVDTVAERTHHNPEGLAVGVSISLLTALRGQIRDAVKAEASSAHGWVLGNDDVYFNDWTQQLV